MAKVIVVVSDPLGLKTSGNVDPLVLGDYVTIEIQGRILKSVIELPRSALRDGNNVWIYENGKLDIRPVALVWKDGERVFVESGIVSGAQVIVSDLSIPVHGMNLELSSKDKATGQLDPAPPKAG